MQELYCKYFIQYISHVFYHLHTNMVWCIGLIYLRYMYFILLNPPCLFRLLGNMFFFNLVSIIMTATVTRIICGPGPIAAGRWMFIIQANGFSAATLPETNIRSLWTWAGPLKEMILPTIDFQGRTVTLQGGYLLLHIVSWDLNSERKTWEEFSNLGWDTSFKACVVQRCWTSLGPPPIEFQWWCDV